MPQGPLSRKHAGGPERDQNRQKSTLVADELLQSGQSPRKLARKLPKKLPRPIRFPTIRGPRPKRRIMILHGRAGHCGEGRQNSLWSASVAGGGCPLGPRHIRRTDDEGRSRQGKDRRGCEGFATGPAEAGVARKSQAAEVAGERARRYRRRIFRKRRRVPR